MNKMYRGFTSPTDSILQPLEYLKYRPSCTVKCGVREAQQTIHLSGSAEIQTYMPCTRDREGYDSSKKISRDTFEN